MLHLTKTKTGFQVVLVSSGNSEPLSVSEILTTKDKAKKNIAAQVVEFGNDRMRWQDDTGKVSKTFFYYPAKRKHLFAPISPVPHYVAGKNPKKKKN